MVYTQPIKTPSWAAYMIIKPFGHSKDTTGYEVAENELTLDDLDVEVQCATGYKGMDKMRLARAVSLI